MTEIVEKHFLVCDVCGAYREFPTYKAAEKEYRKLQHTCPICTTIGGLCYKQNDPFEGE